MCLFLSFSELLLTIRGEWILESFGEKEAKRAKQNVFSNFRVGVVRGSDTTCAYVGQRVVVGFGSRVCANCAHTPLVWGGVTHGRPRETTGGPRETTGDIEGPRGARHLHT